MDVGWASFSGPSLGGLGFLGVSLDEDTPYRYYSNAPHYISLMSWSCVLFVFFLFFFWAEHDLFTILRDSNSHTYLTITVLQTQTRVHLPNEACTPDIYLSGSGGLKVDQSGT